MTMDGRRVVIAGGGTGGAAAALLLANDGARVTLHEKVREPRAVGAGILLQPNGLGVLYGLGFEAPLRATSVVGRQIDVLDGAGGTIVHMPTPDFGAGLDHVVVVRRSALLSILLDAVTAHPNVEARLGSEVVDAKADGTVVSRRGDDVTTEVADMVVGADGLPSVVREHGRFGARLTPTVHYVRGMANGAATGSMVEHWTRLGLFGCASVDADTTYLYASAGAPPLADALARRDLAALTAAWRDALPRAGELFALVPTFDALLVNRVVRVDCTTWVDGRLVLLGDAAHAMSPNLGQGANSALVDAAVLAVELRAPGEQADALERYDRRRRPGVRRVQDVAGLFARLCEIRSPVLQAARNSVSRIIGRFDDGVRVAQQEDPAWLRAAATPQTT